MSWQLKDSFGRQMRDLRISLTDRCNFRCVYCLPETEEAANFYRSKFDGLKNPKPVSIGLPPLKPRAEILTFEEIERIARLAVLAGIEKIRLTGGEPLLRADVEQIVASLARIPGLKDLAITTNGFLFPEKGPALKAAGLQRVSISLDSLDRVNFKRLTGRDGLHQALYSIQLAKSLQLKPIKINAVIIRGLNDHEIEDLASFALREKVVLRFIEFMPLDSSRTWQSDMVVPGREILQRLQARFDLRPISGAASETARRWTIEGDQTQRDFMPDGDSPSGEAEIGIIAPVTEPFCGHCNRLRLTADGNIRTCLFSAEEHNLKADLRLGASDEQLLRTLERIVWQKEPGHKIGQSEFVQPLRTMSCIGG